MKNLGAWALLAVAACSKPEPGTSLVTEAHSIVLFDAGAPPDPHRWSIRRTELKSEVGPADGWFGLGWMIRALGPDGSMAGEVAFPGRQDIWVADPEGNIWLQQDGLGEIANVRGLGTGARFCGGRYVNIAIGTEGRAIVGTFDGGASLVWPSYSDCYGMSPEGFALIVAGGYQNYVVGPDGGQQLVDGFPLPDGGSNVLAAYGINDPLTVVGAVLQGVPLGFGNPTGFCWRPDGGHLLTNGSQDAVAFAVSSNGIVVGDSIDEMGNRSAFRWQTCGSPGEALPSPPGIIEAYAKAVNAKGLVVGYGLDSNSTVRGLVWWRDAGYYADDVVGAPALHLHSLSFANDEDRFAGITYELTTLEDGGGYGTSRTYAFDVDHYPE